MNATIRTVAIIDPSIVILQSLLCRLESALAAFQDCSVPYRCILFHCSRIKCINNGANRGWRSHWL